MPDVQRCNHCATGSQRTGAQAWRARALSAGASVAALAMAIAPLSASAAEPAADTGRQPAGPLPTAIVDYDFSSLAQGSSTIPNSAPNSPWGNAFIVDSAQQTTAGEYADSALTMGGSYYVKLPDNILKNKASITVSTVVRNDQFNSSGLWTYLWSLGGTGQAGAGSWATSTHTSLYTSITSRANGDGETYFSASENLSLNAFQTLTATIDGTTNMVTLYINGRNVGSSKATTNPSQFTDQTHNVIGESRYPGVGDALFHGAVRKFTVYDTALTQRQVAQTLPSEGVSDLLEHQVSALAVPPSANREFSLPLTTDDASIHWSSNNGAITVDNTTGTATVTQPAADVSVSLTATLSANDGLAQPPSPVSRTFTVTVPKTVSDRELRELIAEGVTVDNPERILGDLLLPAHVELKQYGITGNVSWVSSNPKVLQILPLANGADNYATVVTRPDCPNPVAVTLTATVSQNRQSPVDILNQPVVKDIDVNVQPQSAGADPTHSRVSIHDPAIVKDNGKYYSFGSHRAFARSTDLQHWEYFYDNLTDDYEHLLSGIWQSWPKQESNPDVTGNMWAPEVIWNPTMRKWNMYLSLNGGGAHQKTVMVLLVADTIEGDWSVVGPVIFSGFDASDASETDVYRVLGDHADLSRYQSLQDTGINAIDASVKTDEHGDMWMALGSWFGGIWMIKLNPQTGLRDYATTYPTIRDASDAYYGHKIAGGHGNSGEGTALTHAGDYWYLMLSYGGLTQTGGYQMREFRSKHIYGPYLDQNGNPAIYKTDIDDKALNRGLRILSSYDQPGSGTITTAQGGNAILNDDDGSIYNVFHTRFVSTSGNLERHEVRVHQMLLSPDGWLVMAPYETSGKMTTANSYTREAVAGQYAVVVHQPTKSYAGGGSSDSSIYHSVPLELRANGTIAGAVSGTWSLNGSAVTLDICPTSNGTTPQDTTCSSAKTLLHGLYQARLGTQMDETGKYAMFFTGVGGDVFTDNGPDAIASGGAAAVWGTKPVGARATTGSACPTQTGPIQTGPVQTGPASSNSGNPDRQRGPRQSSQSTGSSPQRTAQTRRLADAGAPVTLMAALASVFAIMFALVAAAAWSISKRRHE